MLFPVIDGLIDSLAGYGSETRFIAVHILDSEFMLHRKSRVIDGGGPDGIRFRWMGQYGC